MPIQIEMRTDLWRQKRADNAMLLLKYMAIMDLLSLILYTLGVLRGWMMGSAIGFTIGITVGMWLLYDSYKMYIIEEEVKEDIVKQRKKQIRKINVLLKTTEEKENGPDKVHGISDA